MTTLAASLTGTPVIRGDINESTIRKTPRILRMISLLTLGSVLLLVTAGSASAQPDPDPFWRLTGNTPTAAQFFGTTNARPIRFFTNNVYHGLIHQNGYVGLGTRPSPLSGFQGVVTQPQSQLHLGEQLEKQKAEARIVRERGRLIPADNGLPGR